MLGSGIAKPLTQRHRVAGGMRRQRDYQLSAFNMPMLHGASAELPAKTRRAQGLLVRNVVFFSHRHATGAFQAKGALVEVAR